MQRGKVACVLETCIRRIRLQCNPHRSRNDLTFDRLESLLPRASDPAFLLAGAVSAIFLFVQVRLRRYVDAYRVDDSADALGKEWRNLAWR